MSLLGKIHWIGIDSSSFLLAWTQLYSVNSPMRQGTAAFGHWAAFLWLLQHKRLGKKLWIEYSLALGSLRVCFLVGQVRQVRLVAYFHATSKKANKTTHSLYLIRSFLPSPLCRSSRRRCCPNSAVPWHNCGWSQDISGNRIGLPWFMIHKSFNSTLSLFFRRITLESQPINSWIVQFNCFGLFQKNRELQILESR